MLLDLNLCLQQSAPEPVLGSEPTAPVQDYFGGDSMRPLRRVSLSAAILLPAVALLAAALGSFSQPASAQTLPPAPGRMGHFGRPLPSAPNAASTSANATPAAAAQGPSSAGGAALVSVQK